MIKSKYLSIKFKILNNLLLKKSIITERIEDKTTISGFMLDTFEIDKNDFTVKFNKYKYPFLKYAKALVTRKGFRIGQIVNRKSKTCSEHSRTIVNPSV